MRLMLAGLLCTILATPVEAVMTLPSDIRADDTLGCVVFNQKETKLALRLSRRESKRIRSFTVCFSLWDAIGWAESKRGVPVCEQRGLVLADPDILWLDFGCGYTR